ncbi:protein-disulfide isomerase [Shewanella sp. WXL01]|uniref:Protein-disulfide isomerase n=1 Tax=Shewanella maritima TaxID=2520507 RepID=A0A411PK61_9GAMM|nr:MULTISPECIES: DsbA family protein [Shewanella]NKF50828.1 protein-disulfide isomerase [Shewanella sp. WXL01]QBF83812.1 protein-disulfide isomerase [Shewanella maritima]
MSTELYFVYDSHCPWSYAATRIVNELHSAYPKMVVNLLHTAHFIGKDCAGEKQVNAVIKASQMKFGKLHLQHVNSPKNSIKAANFMRWLQAKQPQKQLDVLNALQHAHFVEGNPLDSKHNFNTITEQFKLSPSGKVFKNELSLDAEQTLEDIAEIQQVLGTQSFPALVMVFNDNAIFIDHSKYLASPQAVLKDVEQEIKAMS